MSRLAGPSTRSILYCNPEQPPPMTETLSAPCGPTLPLQQLRELRRSASGNLHQTLIPDLVFYFTHWRHARISDLRRSKANAGGLRGRTGRRFGVSGGGVLGTEIATRPFCQEVPTKLMNLCKRRYSRSPGHVPHRRLHADPPTLRHVLLPSTRRSADPFIVTDALPPDTPIRHSFRHVLLPRHADSPTLRHVLLPSTRRSADPPTRSLPSPRHRRSRRSLRHVLLPDTPIRRPSDTFFSPTRRSADPPTRSSPPDTPIRRTADTFPLPEIKISVW